MSSISAVAGYLKEHAPELAIQITEEIIRKLEMDIPASDIARAKQVYAEFLGFLGESLMGNGKQDPEGLVEWSRANGEREAARGGRISDVITRYPATRLVFVDKISEVWKLHDLTADDMLWLNKRLNYMLDLSVNETIFAFERQTEKTIKRTQQEVMELSAPVVPIQDGLAVLPLVGSIDYDRASLILEKAVPKVAQLKTECLIIDFSGIITIDETVAKHIFDIHNVLRLLGINSIATGLRAEVAQTAVQQGIDFSSIKTFATVRQAIESLNLNVNQ
ncbi:STAS domain-containing protein [Bacillus sp. T33-2]|uniref:STAS domain-containing protein n=1 Tax=Bacillus sp. T33-2 TaxID=2054168 RepID=UPI002155DAED|nr:STAS domain-containing protein [Bacillus sp. T33-2]